jgi:hypothetical protein
MAPDRTSITAWQPTLVKLPAKTTSFGAESIRRDLTNCDGVGICEAYIPQRFFSDPEIDIEDQSPAPLAHAILVDNVPWGFFGCRPDKIQGSMDS